MITVRLIVTIDREDIPAGFTIEEAAEQAAASAFEATAQEPTFIVAHRGDVTVALEVTADTPAMLIFVDRVTSGSASMYDFI